MLGTRNGHPAMRVTLPRQTGRSPWVRRNAAWGSGVIGWPRKWGDFPDPFARVGMDGQAAGV